MPEGTRRLDDVAARVQATQWQITRRSNQEIIQPYRSTGEDILDRWQRLGWGSKVIDRLSTDLQFQFPGRRGFSPTNLDYIRRMVFGSPKDPVSQQLAGELPWGHVMALRGVSVNVIARWLTAEGPPLPDKNRQAGSGAWNWQTVDGLLHNPILVGRTPEGYTRWPNKVKARIETTDRLPEENHCRAAIQSQVVVVPDEADDDSKGTG
jgi:hypothetical protein